MDASRALHRVLPALALISFLTGTQPAEAAGLGPRVGPNVNVSRLSGNQAETAIAINPTDPSNLAIATNQEGPGMFEAYSLDGGATWTGQVIADGDRLGNACCDPSLAFDDFGNLFFIYLGSGAHDVSAALSTNGGRSFRFLQQVETSKKQGLIPTKGGPSVDQPTVTTGPGAVYVLYKLFARGQFLVVNAAKVSGLGRVGAFGSAEPVPGTKKDTFGDIAVGPRGQVMVTYQNYVNLQGPSAIGVNVDPDGLGPEPFGAKIAVAISNVGTFDFIPPQPDRSVDAEVAVSWDRSGGSHTGRAYLAYTDENPDESNNTDILVRHSDDQGATWSAPLRVNDDSGTNSQFNPDIAVDQTTGHVAVSFYDARNDLGKDGSSDTDGVPNDDAQYWGAISTNGGTSFGPNVRISTGTSHVQSSGSSTDYGDYNGMAFQSGAFHPAWADNSNSTGDNPDGALHSLDVYTAAVSG